MTPVAVYRLFNAENDLLYVGMSGALLSRLTGHFGREWWPEVTRIEVEHFDGRIAASHAEREAIAIGQPTHNRSAGFEAKHDSLDERREARQAREAELRRIWGIEYRSQYTAPASCTNCGKERPRLQKGTPITEQACPTCKCKTLVRIEEAA